MPMWGAALAVVGAIGSARSAKKARKAQEQQNRLQRELNKLKNKQTKRSYMRAFRAQQASAVAAAVASGIGLESSALQGTLASQRRQAGTYADEFLTMDRLGGEITSAMNAQSKYNFQSQIWGQASQIGMQFASFTPKSPTTGDKDVSSGAEKNNVASM